MRPSINCEPQPLLLDENGTPFRLASQLHIKTPHLSFAFFNFKSNAEPGKKVDTAACKYDSLIAIYAHPAAGNPQEECFPDLDLSQSPSPFLITSKISPPTTGHRTC
jgi:hypothetical protein